MQELSEEERKYINDLLLLEADGLYMLIPPLLSEYTSTQFREEGQKQAGMDEFEKRKSRINQALCIDWNACEKLRNDLFQDRALLIASIADAVSASTFGIPPFIVAVLIFKLGLRQFCHCDDTSHYKVSST
jgi:hypothetical protein